jgi:hypothetical protein
MSFGHADYLPFFCNNLLALILQQPTGNSEMNCPTRNQKAQACKHQAYPCQSLHCWCLERVAAQVHVLLEPCYILATCSKLWSISGNVYIFFLEIWQLCGLFHQTTSAGFTTLFICSQVAIFCPKKNTICEQGSFVSIL